MVTMTTQCKQIDVKFENLSFSLTYLSLIHITAKPLREQLESAILLYIRNEHFFLNGIAILLTASTFQFRGQIVVT